MLFIWLVLVPLILLHRTVSFYHHSFTGHDINKPMILTSGVENKNDVPVEQNVSLVHVTPTIPKKRLLRIDHFNGQLCNCLQQIAVAVSYCKRNNFDLLITNPVVVGYMRNLDEKSLQTASYPVNVIISDTDPSGYEIHGYEAQTHNECAFKRSFDFIRGIKPKLEFRDIAEKKYKQLYDTGVTTVSIHLRRAQCNEFHEMTLQDWFFKWAQCYYLNRYDLKEGMYRYCREYLDDYLVGLLNEYSPKFNLTRFALHVSTDIYSNDFKEGIYKANFVNDNLRKEIAKMDASFLNRANHKKYGIVQVTYTDETDNMLIDMWISTLTNLHKGNIHSTCDIIVATWRSAMNNNGPNYVIPKSCFADFAKMEKEHFCV